MFISYEISGLGFFPSSITTAWNMIWLIGSQKYIIKHNNVNTVEHLSSKHWLSS